MRRDLHSSLKTEAPYVMGLLFRIYVEAQCSHLHTSKRFGEIFQLSIYLPYNDGGGIYLMDRFKTIDNFPP